jgi:hypothetical protein
MGGDPASGVAYHAGAYQVVVPTSGLPAGTYQVRVHLGSSGEGYVSAQLVLR